MLEETASSVSGRPSPYDVLQRVCPRHWTSWDCAGATFSSIAIQGARRPL